MTFDDELTLISITHAENEMGDIVEVEERLDILCDVLSVTRSEHYAATAQDMKPSIVFVVNKYDYSKQQRVEFDNEEYKVMRTYAPKKSKDLSSFETIELICEGVVGNGNA